MTGERLKEVLYQAHVSQSELARRLEMSQQALNAALSAADIKTGLLERICEALGVDMGFFYPIGKSNNNVNNIKKQSAHNLHNGSGNITENVGPSQDALTIALQQNAELIALLKAEKGL